MLNRNKTIHKFLQQLKKDINGLNLSLMKNSKTIDGFSISINFYINKTPIVHLNIISTTVTREDACILLVVEKPSVCTECPLSRTFRY